jgi:hypothetical protein
LQPSLAGAAAGASTEQNRAEPSVPCFAPHKTELRGKKWWARVGYSRFFQRHSMLLIMDFVGWILQLVYFVMTWYGLMRDLPQPF